MLTVYGSIRHVHVPEHIAPVRPHLLCLRGIQTKWIGLTNKKTHPHEWTQTQTEEKAASSVNRALSITSLSALNAL